MIKTKSVVDSWNVPVIYVQECTKYDPEPIELDYD